MIDIAILTLDYWTDIIVYQEVSISIYDRYAPFQPDSNSDHDMINGDFLQTHSPQTP